MRIHKKPYYAVIFSSVQKLSDTQDYEKAAEKMFALVEKLPGFLGVESVRDSNGFGITVSYWDNLESIRSWKENIEHKSAQAAGKKSWYSTYTVRVAKIEREYEFSAKV